MLRQNWSDGIESLVEERSGHTSEAMTAGKAIAVCESMAIERGLEM